MSNITIIRYQSTHKAQWSQFVANSRNALFMFKREFMDYHSSRFDDFSLMIFEGKRLLALLPLNRENDEVISHGGLTYGGMLFDHRMSSNKMIALFANVSSFLVEDGVKTLVYKAIPHIYHRIPSQEDLYALTLLGGTLIRRDLSSVIDLKNIIKMSKGRKYQINQARKAGVTVERQYEYSNYWELLTDVVSKHGAKPTHTLSEIEALAASFPKNIRLYEATKDGELQAGVVVFDNLNVIHTQYMAASDTGLKCYIKECFEK